MSEESCGGCGGCGILKGPMTKCLRCGGTGKIVTTGDPQCPVCGGYLGSCHCASYMRQKSVFQGPAWLRKDRPVGTTKVDPPPKTLDGCLEDELGDPLLAQIFGDAIRELVQKNADYSGSEDRIRNFRKTADATGISMELVWLVYFSKGMDAIQKYCREGDLSSEMIEGRIVDAMNYLALFWLIVNDRRKEGG